MITFAAHKEPRRVLRLAVLDDIAPAEKGTVIEYWIGPSDWEPAGLRMEAFTAARELSGMGKIVLCQKSLGDGVYSYRGVVA